MKHRHLTLMHGGRCPCERCRFEHRAAVIGLFLLAIACGFLAVLIGAWP